MSEILQAAMSQVLLDPVVMLTILLSCIYGIFVGGIPGLTATMAVALMVPLTFFMGEVQAIAAIVTTTTCSIFAGDIPATLVRIPGTPASAAYASDSYKLAQQGQYTRVLSISLLFSVIGGLFGVAVLSLAAPQLAQLATKFRHLRVLLAFRARADMRGNGIGWLAHEGRHRVADRLAIVDCWPWPRLQLAPIDVWI